MALFLGNLTHFPVFLPSNHFLKVAICDLKQLIDTDLKPRLAGFKPLISQIAMLKKGRGQHRKSLPYAFTENGSIMAANT